MKYKEEVLTAKNTIHDPSMGSVKYFEKLMSGVTF